MEDYIPATLFHYKSAVLYNHVQVLTLDTRIVRYTLATLKLWETAAKRDVHERTKSVSGVQRWIDMQPDCTHTIRVLVTRSRDLATLLT